MSMKEAIEHYSIALKEGQKYYKLAVTNGTYPYPPVLDRILDENDIVERTELGLVNIPMDLIAGTKTEGRVSALAGNFMPILGQETEFATKWIDLCEAHLGNEGIRDPILCFEYLGRFYVQEGNKRVSVLKSYGDPYVLGYVTRLLPAYSDDHVVQIYYEFLDFYALAGIYGIVFRHPGCYAKLQARLGLEPDHVWTDEERKRFSSTFALFKRCYSRVLKSRNKEDPTPAEALLVWLGLFSFSDIRTLADSVIEERLTQMMPDIWASAEHPDLDVVTEPEGVLKGFWAKLFSVQRDKKLQAAFIYDQIPEYDSWTRSHEYGRVYIEKRMSDKVETRAYISSPDSYYLTMEKAVRDGADVIFTISPLMVEESRKIAANYKNIKVLNCSLSQSYLSVRAYYGRIYECKFITGAIAGAMANNNDIGYVANFPIYGTMASINAFALGAKLTNPRARIKLEWSCLPGGEEIKKFLENGIYVISNKDASNLKNSHWNLEWGTYLIKRDGSLMPLAVPCWNWGKLYEKMVSTIYYGMWSERGTSQAVNYWWGMDSGVIDLQFSDDIPDGVRSLAMYLREGLIDKKLDIFKTRLVDNEGNVRNDGSRSLTSEEIMRMKWLCDNVDGRIPGFDEIEDTARDVVRQVGIYRSVLQPEKEEEAQL